MKMTKDSIEFSTGKQKRCYAGIIGLGGDGEVTYGYDGMIYSPDPEVKETWEPNEILTKEELVELADFMIARWTAFRSRVRQTCDHDWERIAGFHPHWPDKKCRKCGEVKPYHEV